MEAMWIGLVVIENTHKYSVKKYKLLTDPVIILQGMYSD